MTRFYWLLAFLFFFGCIRYQGLPDAGGPTDWSVQTLPPSAQDWSGDPEAGFDYLIYGDYIGTGVPYAFLEKRTGNYRDTVLNRTGNSGKFPFNYNTFTAFNGVEVVAGNCFSCHAGVLNGRVIPGLGSAQSDFTQNLTPIATLTNVLVRMKFGKQSPERAAFEDFGFFYKRIGPRVQTPMPGVNPAFRLEEACVSYRNPQDLTRKRQENFQTPSWTLASDVPPLWNVDKKNALYYNGMGRGDFAKLLMQAAVLGIPDSAAAREVLPHFRDVLAWAAQLDPPAFPQPVDGELAAQGKDLFEDNCAKCHGTYGQTGEYPNKLVSLDIVGTDPYYARYFSSVSGLADWYNRSWFGTSKPGSALEPLDGYVAPPLDGIWATAPYLHNGSVPTLEELLDSPRRPALWSNTGEYDYEKLGWKYHPSGKSKYNTLLRGYSNQGHTFGDRLTAEERKAVLEYLKTL